MTSIDPRPWGWCVFLLLLSCLTACAVESSQPIPSQRPSHITATMPLTATVPLTPTIALTTTSPITATLPLTPTLIVWTTEQDSALEMVRQLAQRYTRLQQGEVVVVAKNPDSVRVDLMVNEATGIALPDLIWGNQEDVAALLYDNQLQPIDTITDTTVFIPSAITGAMANQHMWGHPLTVQGFMLLFYNRTLMQQPPQTTDELIVQSRAFVQHMVSDADNSSHEENQYGIVMGWNEPRWVMTFINGCGGSLTTPDGTRPMLTTPAMTDTLNLLRELYAAAPPEQQTYRGGQRIFRAGKVAMAIDGEWALAAYRHLTPTLDLGIAPMPRVSATGRTLAPALGGSYLMIHRSLPKNKLPLVHNIVHFLLSDEVQLDMAQTLQRLPAKQALLKHSTITRDEVLRIVASSVEEAGGLPPTKGLRCAAEAIGEYMPAVYKGKTAQAQIIAAMQDAADVCMRK